MSRTPDSGETPLFTIRPVYYFSIILARSIPAIIFLVVFITGIFTVIGTFFGIGLPEILGINRPEESTVLIFSAGLGTIISVISVFVYFFAVKKTYEQREYRFFDGRVEYYEGFFTVVKKSVEYSKIIEVTMTSGVLQKPKNLGSITLLTAATVVDRQGGLIVKDIENPDENYKKIRQEVQKDKDK